jgi:two-component system, chemotaxis family, response regulator Rcp1
MITKSLPRFIEILLVEDSPADILLTREAFKNNKIINEIHVAEDGIQAMDFLYRRGKHASAPRPDLILLDLNLPRKNGREVLAEIKSDPDLRAIPVVVLTTSSNDEDILKAYNLNANCYVVKPVGFENFMKAMQSIRHFWFSVVALPSE